MGTTLCSSFVFLLWSTVKLLRRCGEEISNNQVQVEKKLLDPLKQAWMGAQLQPQALMLAWGRNTLLSSQAVPEVPT